MPDDAQWPDGDTHDDLDFRSGAGRQRSLLIGALVAVIAASLGIIIWQMLIGDEVLDQTDEAVTHCECLESGKTFTVKGGSPGVSFGEMPFKHPMCGPDDYAMVMSVCPACRKHYLSEAAKARGRWHLEQQRNPKQKIPPPAPQDEVCSQCKTNLTEYWERLRKQRKAERKKAGATRQGGPGR